MNLFDLVKRVDRAVAPLPEGVTLQIDAFRGHKVQAVVIPANQSLVVRQASEFRWLDIRPRFPQWYFRLSQPSHPLMARLMQGVPFRVIKNSLSIVMKSSDGQCFPLIERYHPVGGQWVELELNWPMLGQSDAFDLEFRTHGWGGRLFCSYAFNPRLKLQPFIHGSGVEVGPGSNPFVVPSTTVDVRYIESKSIDEWRQLYDRHQQKTDNPNLWEQYICDDAHTLRSIDDKSLDFIFSSHVFEHLMNPLQVLKNWLNKLKSGGVLLGVIPDCRFTFDARQCESQMSEILQESDISNYDITPAKYIKWCTYTAPYNTPEDLIARGYSVHVHYYTPTNFTLLAKELVAQGLISRYELNTSPNNKDFGFVLVRP